MPTKKKTLEELEDLFEKLEKKRDRLDSTYWKRSEELTTEWEELMKQLDALPNRRR